MKALVVGYGSIGSRHARILGELGLEVTVVSERAVDFPRVHASVASALNAARPDYAVIANSTDRHLESVRAFLDLGYTGTILVEKPICRVSSSVQAAAAARVFVAYNLRFHPVIQRLASKLESERIVSVIAYVGQYLPDWRPSVDYRKSYSASSSRGGGVLRDLSHEIDYLTWMLGGWRRVAALGGKLSSLETESEDAFSLLLDTPRCSCLSIHLDYLHRPGRRLVIVNTDEHTFEVDLIAGSLTMNGKVEMFVVQRDDTYRAMHTALLAGDMRFTCSADEGLATLKIIEGAQRAAVTGQWVGND